MSTPYTPLLDLLDAGELLLTPTSASARALRHHFEERQRARGLRAWEPARVLSWSQFTAGLWTSLVLSGHETRLLTNTLQEHALWREVIATTTTQTAIAAMSSPDALAELASSAFQLAARHRSVRRLSGAANSPDTRVLAAWADAFERLLQVRECLVAAQLDDALAEHLRRGSLAADRGKDQALPERLHLVAFPEADPAQQSLLDALEAAGLSLQAHGLAQVQTAPPMHLLAADPHAELQVVAEMLAELFGTADPPAQVTVLLPEPAAARAELESVLRTTLAPELNDIASDLSAQPWEFTSGAPLASQALIADALDLLRLATGRLALSRVSPLLLSPFLGDPKYREGSGRFDAWLRSHYRSLRPELDLAMLVRQLETFRNSLVRAQSPVAGRLPAWPEHLLAQLRRTPLDAMQPRSHSDWADALRLLLRAAEFPPTEDLTATTFALTRSWDSLLDVVATLDFSGRRVALDTVLAALERAAQTTAFAMPATNAPIQIMSYAEAAAIAHEVVVVVRANDADLPPRPRPHPLLPWTLQRDLGLPGVDPAADAARARTAFLELLATSGSVHLTSAAEDADGKLRPSPLLAACNIATRVAAGQRPSSASIELEQVNDDDPLPPSPTHVRGGASVLTLQAACGFRAFAQLRLQAADLDDPGLGLDAGESGSLLHRTLHAFWSRVRSREDLIAMSEPARIDLLDDCIARAMEGLRLLDLSAWDFAYTSLVTRRLRSLLLQWLGEEERRGPFTVARLEAEEEILVGPLTLTVRMDRVDTVQDTQGGGAVFVDYKTSASAHPKQWTTARPEEPQLPLYALLSREDPGQVKALAFARIRTGDMRWHGLETEQGILPPARDTVREIPELIAEWQDTLTTLAQAFHDGEVSVNPMKYPHTCAYCGQRLLCRLDPTTLAQVEAMEDEASDEE